MADVNGVLQIEMGSHRSKIIGVVIHVMAVSRLRGSAVPAAVMSDHAVTFPEKEQHLRIPVIGRERPAMTKHDGLSFPPILIEDFSAILRFDETHVYLHEWTGAVRMSVIDRASGARIDSQASTSGPLVDQSGEEGR